MRIKLVYDFDALKADYTWSHEYVNNDGGMSVKNTTFKSALELVEKKKSAINGSQPHYRAVNFPAEIANKHDFGNPEALKQVVYAEGTERLLKYTKKDVEKNLLPNVFTLLTAVIEDINAYFKFLNEGKSFLYSKSLNSLLNSFGLSLCHHRNPAVHWGSPLRMEVLRSSIDSNVSSGFPELLGLSEL